MRFREPPAVISHTITGTLVILFSALFTVSRLPFRIPYASTVLFVAAGVYTAVKIAVHFTTFYIISEKSFSVGRNFLRHSLLMCSHKDINVCKTKRNAVDILFKTRQLHVITVSRTISLTIRESDWEKLNGYFVTHKVKPDSSVTVSGKVLIRYAFVNPSKIIKAVNYILSLVTAALLLFLKESPVVILVVSYVVAIFISIIANMLLILIKYRGYKMDFFNERLTLEYGLFTKVTVFLPFRAVEGVLTKRNLLNRLFLSYAPYILVAGSGRRKHFSLCPIINKGGLARLLYNLKLNITEPSPIAEAGKETLGLYLYPVLIPLLLTILAALLVSYSIVFLYIILGLVTAVIVLDRIMSINSTRASEHENILALQTGGIFTKQLYFKKASLKGWKLITTPPLVKKQIFKLKLYLLRGVSFTTGYMLKDPAIGSPNEKIRPVLVKNP